MTEKRTPAEFIMEFLGYIVKISAAWGFIATVIWFVFEPRIRPYLQFYEQTPISIAELKVDIDEQGRQISRLRTDLEGLRTQPVIAQYDSAFTKMATSKCKIGEECIAEFVVKRTKEGASCGVPTSQKLVRNHNGRVRPAERSPNSARPIRASPDTWLTLQSRFLVPFGSKPGQGEYFLKLEYPDCNFMPEGEMAIENSPTLFFEIIE